MTSGTPGIPYIVGAAKLLTHISHSTEALQNAACKVPESGRAGGLPAPKVSVIVVNYNQGQYLSQAVDSVLRQTFKDLEIIIVDDGSRDNSIGIIHSMTGRDPERMRFCCHPNHQNLGISRTYALGIAEAKSMYVAFLEADDYWGRNYLERKVELLDSNPEIGVVFSKYRIVSTGWYGCDMALRQWILGLCVPNHIPFNNLGNLMKKNNVATFSAFVTRKSLLDQVSWTLPADILYFDWWILAQLSMRSKFFLDKASLVYWRQHSDSALGKQGLTRHQTMLGRFMQQMYEEIGRQFDTLGEQDKALYLRNRSLLPHFLEFYQNPGSRHFLKFFHRDPMWTLESIASYCVNRWKYLR